MKQHETDHTIAIEPHKAHVRIAFKGDIIADTQCALVLREASYPAVFYIPRADVSMDFLIRSIHTSHCPYKGDAAYFSISVGGQVAENSVWTYEAPFPGVATIKDYLAFHLNHVDMIDVEK